MGRHVAQWVEQAPYTQKLQSLLQFEPHIRWPFTASLSPVYLHSNKGKNILKKKKSRLGRWLKGRYDLTKRFWLSLKT